MNRQVVLRWLLLALSLSFVSALGTARAEAVKQTYSFKRGVNISHWLSQNAGARVYGAPWFGEDDVEWIAKQGFDHIRLPVDVRSCMTAEGKLDPAKLKPIADAIDWCRHRGLGLVLDAHFLPGADFNSQGGDKRVFTDMALQEKVAGVWRELAKAFARHGDYLRMEILNEPVAEENKQLNPFIKRMLAVIRESNPTRIVYIPSNMWNQFATVKDLELPDDPNIALEVHNYEPLIFTHQRASWVDLDETLPPVPFPGKVPDWRSHLLRPPHEPFDAPGTMLTTEKLDEMFDEVAAWVAKNRPGMEVYLGEFGVYRPADDASKINWLQTMVRNCEKRGWGWAVWDYKGGFAVRGPDGKGTAVLEGLLGHRGE
jgi:endoglucanase